MRKFINTISIINGVPSCKDRSGKFISIQKTQGDLDGACATYCVIMNLLLLGKIYDSDTKIESKPKDSNTRKLIRTFFSEYGMHHSGQTFYKIRKMLLDSFCNVIECIHYAPTEENTTREIIKTSVNNNRPIIVSVGYRGGGGHALLAVGYESYKGNLSKIFCLDPGTPKVSNKRWNAIIELDVSPKLLYKNKYFEYDVTLDDVLLITAK